MKKLFFIYLSILLFACNNNQDYKISEADQQIALEAANKIVKEKNLNIDSFLLKTIDKKFITYKTNEIDKSLISMNIDYLSFNNKAFEAKLLKTTQNDSIIAINNIIEDVNCNNYEAFILKQDINGEWHDVFESLYPDLSIYSFYGFEDKQVGQLEGDEKTVFAGYKFHFDKADSLGVQFMFCNLNSVKNTKKLNENGKIIYTSF